ncbi:hypothetical protein ACKF11_13940 [Methylobacillus sp. Pita2]|uniref:A1S_2505 family phage non-structural protein n=1 Tax=Methylobacillus sp. Pita2 TaxID=3383245 RepID=UPI0038B5C093
MIKINLASNSVSFVFGSNQAGRHGKGAAAFAKEEFSAAYGVGEGVSGRSYGIPTKDFNVKTRPLADIVPAIAKFISHAKRNSTTTFFVTRIGCELAGFKDEVIAPLFKDAPANCILPFAWEPLVGRQSNQTVLVLPGMTNVDLHKIMTNLSPSSRLIILGDTKDFVLDERDGLQITGLPVAKINKFARFFENYIDMIIVNDSYDLQFAGERRIYKLDVNSLFRPPVKPRSVFKR